MFDGALIEGIGFCSVKREGAKRFAISHQRERDARSITPLYRLGSPRSDTRVGLDVLGPRRFAGTDSCTDRTLTLSVFDQVAFTLSTYPCSYPACATGRTVFSVLNSRYPTQAIRSPPTSTRMRQTACKSSDSSVAWTRA